MQVINLSEKFNLFTDHWKPKVIGELNGQQVKLAKMQGEFVWHDHSDETNCFLLLKANSILPLKTKQWRSMKVMGVAIFLASNPIGWVIGASAAVYFAGRLAYDIYEEVND